MENIRITQEDPEQIIRNVIVEGVKQQLQIFVHEDIFINVIVAVDIQNFGLVIHRLNTLVTMATNEGDPVVNAVTDEWRV